MATYFTLTERRNTCPACYKENVLIGSDLIDGVDVHCSRCGSLIGRWHETRDLSLGDKLPIVIDIDESVRDE